MNNVPNNPLFSRKTENWKTPKDLFSELNAEFHFMTDPCTFPDNPLGLPVFFTKETNGLDYRKWKGNVYINPPYGLEITDWLEQGRLYAQEGRGTVVYLLPSRTDTKWFHEYCYNKAGVELRFLKGRVKFEGVSEDYKRNSAPFPSVIVIFHKKPIPQERAIVRVTGQ